MRKALLTLLALCCLAPAAFAQNKVVALSYTISLPGSETKDFIEQASFRGADLAMGVATGYGSRLMVGVAIGWETFYHKSTELIQMDNGAVFGLQQRYVNAAPMYVTGHCYAGSRDSWRGFVGLGAGALYVNQRFTLGIYQFENGVWHFAVAPEAGVQHPLGGTNLHVSARYNYAFKAGSGEALAWDYWSIHVGLAWTEW